MIKPESNAPASMKPWVRTTDKQIEELETAVSKITNTLNAGNSSIDHEQNQSLSNTFSFTPLDDGSTVTNSQAMNFTGAITSESDISIAGSLIVGDPSRQQYDPLSGEATGSIPNLEVISGQLEINPVTEVEYYTTGKLNMTDTSFNVDAYGLIHGDGLQIVLANDGNAERQNIEILGATGTGTAETFQIANNTSNVAIYTAGKYVNITGVDPVGYNGSNLLITSVDTGISPMTFTVTGTESGAYVGGGYVTINQANSTYEGKLSVQGPAPDYTGVTIEQDGVFIGSNGGDPNIAIARLDSTGLTAPSAFIDQAVINGTRLFISPTAPTAVNDGDIWIDKTGIFTQGGGSVTSVGMTVPTGLTVSPSSITTSGTFAIGLQSGYAIPPTSTTVGSNFFTLTNPSAITFPRINADNTVSALDAATFRTAIGAGTPYTLPKATDTALGGVELFNATVQTVAANTATTTAGRTYGAQLNAADQLVINVPWTDTVYSLPDATASVKGGVIVGNTLAIVSGTINLPTTGITAASYTNTNLTVDAYGRITAIANGSGGGSGFTGAGTSITGVQSAAGVALPISTSTVSTGNSGAISIITGTVSSASTPTSGAVTIKSGDGASSIAHSGAITIQTGAGSGSGGNSGSLTIDTGAGSGSGSAGSILIGTTNSPILTIGKTGAAIGVTGTTTFTGSTTITAPSTTSSPGASHSITAGSTSAASGVAGSITITGGNSTNASAITSGGSVTIKGGNGNFTQGSGGSVNIDGGTGSSTNGNGSVAIGNNSSTDLVQIGRTGASIVDIRGALQSTLTLKSTSASSTPPLLFTAQTGTPLLNAGSIDFDGNAFLGTPKVNNTTAGKGLIPTQQYFVPNANTTINTITGSVGTFSGNAMGNKTIYLAASTTYEVEAVLYVQHTWSATTTTNFSINLLYPTGSTALLNMVSSYTTSTTASTTALQAALNSTTAVVISASPTSGNWFRVVLKGIVKTSTTAGNFSPVFAFTTSSGSTTATNTIGANSFIKVNPIAGVGADINIGGWA